MQRTSLALQKDGPIANRARAALRSVAGQFGQIVDETKSTVSVSTSDETRIELSYELGNYLFSRVYNLRIATVIPDQSRAPSNVKLSFKHMERPRMVGTSRFGSNLSIDNFNRLLGGLLEKIDLLDLRIEDKAGMKRLKLTPMGGSFVWVLIPPVFKPIAFPPNEVERIIKLIEVICNYMDNRPCDAHS